MMRQPWIHNAKTDWRFILSPPFLVLAVVVLFQSQIQNLENHYSFYTWLILIVFVDVAHVYSTLFKTYFIKDEFQKRKLLLGNSGNQFDSRFDFLSVWKFVLLVRFGVGRGVSFCASAIWFYAIVCQV